ncbi:MAG: hypothetical protein C6Y22_30280 [Hapalosiphonaceae cyanobacterium JJU2]|nr:MAG: hypothetical protein C6Y22_30280 [Hapalosiphonaceae cyanobacterium JJU2]
MGKDDAAIIDTNMMGTAPHQFNEQFLNTKYTNKAVKRQCAHLIIAIAHREGYHEHLSNSQYSYVAREYLKDMGFLPKEESKYSDSQFVAVRHSDRNHEHLHIIASRIRLDGSLVNDSYDYFNSQVSTRRIAAQLGLEVTPTTNEAVASRLKQEYGITAPTSPNRSKSIRAVNSKHKTPTSKEIIREAIGEAIKDSPTVSTFIQHLEENNIGVLPKMRGLELLGFTYIHNNVKIAGYQVYKPYSWNKLQSEYGITYEHKRDIGTLQQAKIKAISRIKNTNLSNEEYNTVDKSTSSSTSNNSGDTDSNTSLPSSTYILNTNYTDEGSIVEPTVESKGQKKEGRRKKKVQSPQLQQPQEQWLSTQEEQPEIELSVQNRQNPPLPVETQVEEKKLSPQKKKLRLPIQVAIVKVEEKSSQEKGKSSAEQTTHPLGNRPRGIYEHLSLIITDYMLVTNSPRINGRELSASLDGNILTICRHGDNTPIMQTSYHDGNWYEEIPTKLTTNEIEQIESLRVFTQQALIKKSHSKGGIEQ